MSKDFVHLHVHTEYSLLDGHSRIKDIMAKAKQEGMSHVAITDHGNMFGAVEFFQEAQKQGIKPIIGCEMYVAPRSLQQKESKDDAVHQHLTLLVKNEKGYQNLIKLISQAHLEGFYYRPRTDLQALGKHAEGLIVLSGCLSGRVARALLLDAYDLAKKEAQAYQAIFGENFYIEIINHGLADQKKVLPQLVKLAKELNIPLVATNDVHFVEREDALSQDILLCIQTGKLLADKDRMHNESDQMYFKSKEEMEVTFKNYPQAIENTKVIAEKCKFNFDFSKVYLPRFDVPADFNSYTYLEKLTWDGIHRRYQNVTQEITHRVHYELDIIHKMDYAPYFLIVQDFINWAKNKNIQVGPGRGSAAGSIVAYALKITDIEPLAYNLLFERFLNPERVSMPDIDVDFCIRRRGEVIDYVTQKYGQAKVAQIITFGTMAARGVLRDVGRVLNIPLPVVDKVAKMVPAMVGISLEKALKQNPDLKHLYENDQVIKNLINQAMKLEGLSRHASTHAAGVVISAVPLSDIVPLAQNEGQVVTQYAMNYLEKLGLLKMDFLGLRNLTMIEDALEVIERTQGKKIDIISVPLNDPKTYEFLSKGETFGIFQLESSGMRSLVKKLKPTCFEDLIALLALYRPGPLGSGMVDTFISNKHGYTKINYELPELEPILKSTYGLILYQEQVMQIASELAGFSLGQADLLRRAMGKKKAKEMEKLKQKFIEGAVQKGYPQDKIIKIFDQCAKFAEYGFNKSHSAAYAVISYQTAYLKAHYPLEYMASILTSVADSIDKVTDYIKAAKAMDIEILPPDINESRQHFSVVHGAIRFGFKAIKNLGDNAMESILNTRDKDGAFVSLNEFLTRVDIRTVNKRAVESLIRCGAMDAFGKRSQLLSIAGRALESAGKYHRQKAQGQVSLFGDQVTGLTVFGDQNHLPDIPEFSPLELLQMEKELIGMYISDHPLKHISINLEEKVTAYSRSLDQYKENTAVIVAGIIVSLRRLITKTNKQMLIGALEDTQGKIPLVLFPGKAYEQYQQLFEKEAILLIHGRVSLNRTEPQVVVEEVQNIATNGHNYFNIDISGLDNEEFFQKLKNTLQQNPGSIPVLLHNEGTKILTGREYWIVVNDSLKENVSQLVGANRFWL